MANTPKMYNQDGTLTDYALSCGYIEIAKMGEHSRIILEKEHSTYHVKGIVLGARIWESFTALTPARRLFRDLSSFVHNLPVQDDRTLSLQEIERAL